MKIGLVRHFKVKHAFPKTFLVSYDEVVKWFEDYELAEIENQAISLHDNEWKRCYTSTSFRATKTANIIYQGEITKVDILRELNVLPVMNPNFRLPFLLWAILVRMKTFSSNPITDTFKKNIIQFLDSTLAESREDMLIVSHGFVMMFLRKELKKRGFQGPSWHAPEYGKVYVFEKQGKAL